MIAILRSLRNIGRLPRRVSALLAAIPLLGLAVFAVPSLAASTAKPNAEVHSKTFSLFPNKGFLSCAQAPGHTAKATATVVRGAANDSLTLSLTGFKPHLGFDLFTVQRSNQTAAGTPVAGFTNFGLAWYQSDVNTDSKGHATVTIKTILLDQVFGFDPDASLAPTNTFNLGFWFNSVKEAQPCSATAVKATPFNGEHNAGPVAFITRPNATTNLGPLCTAPEKKHGVFVCEG